MSTSVRWDLRTTTRSTGGSFSLAGVVSMAGCVSGRPSAQVSPAAVSASSAAKSLNGFMFPMLP